MKCVKCQETIPCKVIINEVEISLRNRNKCLNCLPYRSRKRIQQQNSNSQDSFVCQKCGKTRRSYGKWKNTICYLCHAKQNFSQICVSLLGGKCMVCGYSKSLAALHFHHVRDKKFLISSSKTRAWNLVLEELRKCILLCANCHAEVHVGQLDVSSISPFALNDEEAKNAYKTKVSRDYVVNCACGKPKGRYTERCRHCAAARRDKIQWPTKEELSKLVYELPTSRLAQQLGVSDRAIGKRCKSLGITKPNRGYWAKKIVNKI